MLVQIVEDTPLHAQVCFRHLALGVYLSGRHIIRRQVGNNVVEGSSDPGTINLTPPGVEGTWEASASSRAAVVVIRPEFMSRAVEEHWGGNSSKVEVKKRFLIRDPVIETIALKSGAEATGGSAAGRLYVESRCEFLAHHLIYRYSNCPQLRRDPWAVFQAAGSNSFSNTLRTRSVSQLHYASWLLLPVSAPVISNAHSGRVQHLRLTPT